MKVKVSLRSAGGGADNIQITADATVTVGDVAGSLAHSDRRAGEWPADRALTLRIVGDGGAQPAIPADRALVESGIRSGATIEIAFAEEGEAARSLASAAAVLRVIGGPDTGLEFMLPLGSSTLGRAADADVRLSDPMVSKKHCRIVVGARIEMVDAGSSNGVVVGGVRTPRIALSNGEVAQLGDTAVTITRLATTSADATSTDVGFVRSPRVLARPRPTEIELPEVPRAPSAGRFPWLALLAPLAMGAVLLITRLQGGTSFGGIGTALAFIAISPLLMVGNYVDQRGQRRRGHREELAGFDAGLAARRAELAEAHATERARLLELYPSLSTCLEAVPRQSEVLWSRRPEHPEFLHVRLGLGEIAPLTEAVPPRPGGISELYQQAVAVAEEHAVLHDAPVVADLRSVGGLGLCGEPAVLEGVARGLVAQVAALHSPAEVVLACLTGSESRGRWDWLDWLPHTSSPHSPLPGTHLAADPGTGKLVLNQLEELVDLRSQGPAAHRGPLGRDDTADVPTVPSVLVVIDDTSVDTARLTRVAETGPDVGVYVLWVAPEAGALPAACRTFVEVDAAGQAHVGMVRCGRVVAGVGCESVDRLAAHEFARRMAPMYDAGSPVEDQSDLPRSVSVVSLYGHDAADDPTVVLNRWRENQSLVDRSAPPVPREREGDLVAVVGHAGAEQFTLDLRSQGPHALVGGTTGAGKSEFLQAWVLGLAHAYSPDRLTFLFVDYKGGAAFARCVDLPHKVGLVTDLSPYLVRRALRSLRAELHHRERLLNEKGKKDLVELEKSGDPDCPPSLVIVIDEFAALVSEVPEFVDGVVDVAQRGRSLGLHLVLATQRPAGVIKDNLRANTNLRIALRMADEADSHDVLGDQLAAHFPASIPGRGAAKTGPGRITRFQSAFPGARTPVDAEAPVVEVVDLDFGPARPWKVPERPRVATSVAQDIDRVVSSIAAAAVAGRVPAPRKPWLEPLAATYNLARGPLRPRRDTRIPLGVLDDPDRQAQDVEYFEPDGEGNIVYFGAGGSGKSTALRTLAIASAVTPGGGLAQVYALDFSGGALNAIEVLPHVGAVIPGDDEERVQRLIRHLAGVAEERAARFKAANADTLAEYREKAGRPDEPRILLLLDGFTAFRTAFESSIQHQVLYAQFQRLLVEGRSVGLHVAMTADRATSVPNSILSGFQRRVVLRQADEDAYIALGVPRDVLTPASPPGRALQPDKPMELQLAVFLTDEHAGADNSSSAAQVAAMEQLYREIAQHHQRPEPIRSLATLVGSADVPDTVEGRPVLGVADDTLGPIGFDPVGTVMIAGPAQSGRTNAVHWLARSVRRRYPELPLVHLSARRTPLSALDLWDRTADNERDVADLLDELEDLVARPAAPGGPGAALFVEYLPEFLQTGVEQPLLAVLGQSRRNGHLVVAEGEGPSWSAPWPLLMEIRNARTGLLLQPDQADGESLLRTPLPRVKRADLPPGRGYWVRAGRAHKVQVPLVDEWGERPIDTLAEGRQDRVTGQQAGTNDWPKVEA